MIRTLKKLHWVSKGSASVEFVMAFMFASIAFMLAITFIFFAIGGQLMTYAKYMGSRTYKVNEYANIKSVIQKVVPWVSQDEIKFSSKDLELVFDRPERKKCEDNPMWYVEGDKPCK